jgi:bile acid:Na+ symporter, BASS family
VAFIKQVTGVLLLIFMVGSLFGLGLDLALREAVRALRNVRFVLLTLVWGFIVGPAFAYLLAHLIPMAEPYGLGLVLLGMAPVAPFMPMMVERAKGDLAYTAAIMLLAAIGTLVFMPLAVPLMAAGLTADAWTIARPLLLWVLAPLVVGTTIRTVAEPVAARWRPPVKKITNLATVLMLVCMVIVYGRDMWGAVGSFAIGAQVVFLAGMAAGPYMIGFGLPQDQRSVLGIGMCTRNIGAALAPLVAIPGADPRAVVTCVIAVVLTVALALLAASWFSKGARLPGEMAVPAGRPVH